MNKESVNESKLKADNAITDEPEGGFNVRSFDYGDEIQIRVYKKPIKTGVSKSDNGRKENKLTDSDMLKLIHNQDSFDKVLDMMDKRDRDRKNKNLNNSANRAMNKVYELARANEWEYFLTITFDPQKVDSFDYEQVVKKLSQWLDNFKRRKAPNLKYIIVPEKHKSGRFHFHGLLSNIGEMKLTDSGKRDKFKRPIYNLGNYKLGFSTVTEIADPKRSSNYISKYITKTLCESTKGKKRYWASTNLKKPKISEMMLSEEDIKKMLHSLEDNVAHHNTAIGEYQTVDYYEIKISE